MPKIVNQLNAGFKPVVETDENDSIQASVPTTGSVKPIRFPIFKKENWLEKGGLKTFNRELYIVPWLGITRLLLITRASLLYADAKYPTIRYITDSDGLLASSIIDLRTDIAKIYLQI